MIGLLAGIALAGAPELALLPLDAPPGTSTAELASMIQALDDALRAEGHTTPISGEALAARGDPGRRLDEARKAAKEGFSLLKEGDADLAIVFLDESIRHHREIASDVVRRDEMADVWFGLGRAALALGDRDRARTELGRAIAVWPDFEETRTGPLDADTRSLISEAGARLRARSPIRTTPTAASRLSSRLGVGWVVYGGLTDEGLLLYVQSGSAAPATVRRAGPITPSPVTWTAVAADVIAAMSAPPVAAPPAPAVPPDPAPPPAPAPATPTPAPAPTAPPIVAPPTPRNPRRDPRAASASMSSLDLPSPIG